MENPIKMDDLGVSLFLETPRWCFQISSPLFGEDFQFGCCQRGVDFSSFCPEAKMTRKLTCPTPEARGLGATKTLIRLELNGWYILQKVG